MLLPSDKYSYQAKQRAEHVFTVFSDLVEWPGQKLAALDDRAAAYNSIDLERLKTIATLVPVFSDRNSLDEILRAA